MYFAHAVDTDLGTKPQKFLFSWQKKKPDSQKNVIIRITIFLSHIWVISVLENSSLDWVFILADIAGGVFEGNKLWILQHSSWTPLFTADLAFFVVLLMHMQFLPSVLVSLVWIITNLTHLLGCSFVFLYFANELRWLDLVKSFLQCWLPSLPVIAVTFSHQHCQLQMQL